MAEIFYFVVFILVTGWSGNILCQTDSPNMGVYSRYLDQIRRRGSLSNQEHQSGQLDVKHHSSMHGGSGHPDVHQMPVLSQEIPADNPAVQPYQHGEPDDVPYHRYVPAYPGVPDQHVASYLDVLSHKTAPSMHPDQGYAHHEVPDDATAKSDTPPNSNKHSSVDTGLQGEAFYRSRHRLRVSHGEWRDPTAVHHPGYHTRHPASMERESHVQEHLTDTGDQNIQEEFRSRVAQRQEKPKNLVPPTAYYLLPTAIIEHVIPNPDHNFPEYGTEESHKSQNLNSQEGEYENQFNRSPNAHFQSPVELPGPEPTRYYKEDYTEIAAHKIQVTGPKHQSQEEQSFSHSKETYRNDKLHETKNHHNKSNTDSTEYKGNAADFYVNHEYHHIGNTGEVQTYNADFDNGGHDFDDDHQEQPSFYQMEKSNHTFSESLTYIPDSVLSTFTHDDPTSTPPVNDYFNAHQVKGNRNDEADGKDPEGVSISIHEITRDESAAGWNETIDDGDDSDYNFDYLYGDIYPEETQEPGPNDALFDTTGVASNDADQGVDNTENKNITISYNDIEKYANGMLNTGSLNETHGNSSLAGSSQGRANPIVILSAVIGVSVFLIILVSLALLYLFYYRQKNTEPKLLNFMHHFDIAETSFSTGFTNRAYEELDDRSTIARSMENLAAQRLSHVNGRHSGNPAGYGSLTSVPYRGPNSDVSQPTANRRLGMSYSNDNHFFSNRYDSNSTKPVHKRTLTHVEIEHDPDINTTLSVIPLSSRNDASMGSSSSISTELDLFDRGDPSSSSPQSFTNGLLSERSNSLARSADDITTMEETIGCVNPLYSSSQTIPESDSGFHPSHSQVKNRAQDIEGYRKILFKEYDQRFDDKNIGMFRTSSCPDCSVLPSNDGGRKSYNTTKTRDFLDDSHQPSQLEYCKSLSESNLAKTLELYGVDVADDDLPFVSLCTLGSQVIDNRWEMRTGL